MVNIQLQKQDKEVAIPQYKEIEQSFESAFEVVDDVVMKNYITKLSDMRVIPLQDATIEKNISKNVRMFKINEIVYSPDEDATYKLASVLNAVAVTDSSAFIMIDSDGASVDFYMGIRSMNESKSTKTSYDTLKNAMNGHFQGIKTENVLKNDIDKLLNKKDSSAISIVTGVANYKDADLKTNQSFIQGLEKLALSMQGEIFTGVILANPAGANQLIEVRKQYENIYSMLSPLASTQISYGINDSINDTQTFTLGTSTGETDTVNTSSTKTVGENTTTNKTKSFSKNTAGSSAGKLAAGGLTAAGAVLGTVLMPGAGTAAGAAAGLAIGGAIGGAVGGGIAAATHKTVSDTEGTTTGTNKSEAETEGSSNSISNTTNESNSEAKGFTKGNSETIQMTTQNKTIQNYLQRIDQQLIRLQECESLGMWECAAYFTSETPYAADIAAATYKSLMQGENTGVEISNISSWSAKDSDLKDINKYVQNFIHPVFTYENVGIHVPITPASLVSGKELAIHMCLPRKSVSGFPVIEHVDFAQEVISYRDIGSASVNLGSVFNMGKTLNNRVKLDLQSLSMHTLVTGSTGSGKSNTIYELLSQLEMQGIKFLVIEPAKGEYKHVFGSDQNVTVLGTNFKKSRILKINPFKFPEDIHVLEHIDRLVEIFNVCWPMYAAMPAILKEAIIHCYTDCGWDLEGSTEAEGAENYYPTFKDLLSSLEVVINQTAYDSDTKGNYIGSLVTRVKSLTNGINGQIFCDGELDNELLFDSNIIVDLSRIGSSETKSLIMGLLVMRLNEHRMAGHDGLNFPLKHVTVLEEAHNILKRTSTEQSSEGANMIGKSVEMLSNSIAEMRTYGEGFIIVDQSPSMLDMSAIRNTNTKIIMRLPDETDRRLVGKSAGLKDEQLDEIIKLPRGVAAVYQNDWVEPLLCQINHFDQETKPFIFDGLEDLQTRNKKEDISLVCKYLLQSRVRSPESIDPSDVAAAVKQLILPTKVKIQINRYLENEENSRELLKKENFHMISSLVTDVLDVKSHFAQSLPKITDVKATNELLVDYISKCTSDINKETEQAIIQCILRESSTESRRGLELYKCWIEEVRGGRM